METLDMTELLLGAYKLADKINESEEVKRYLECQRRLQEDEEAQRIIKEFQQIKDRYEEAKRFGIFHPNYHEAKEAAFRYQKEMRNHATIRAFLKAEEELDSLLHEVSLMIAQAVSDSIKVPANDPEPGVKKARPQCGGGCGS
ncbi:YlbF family regulator [Laceyella putida]|uniref:YlbF family regulator n=1 Tax=Laceyella putida TaxID=110101 RepID=A0ABW2RK46_9BACL